MAIDFSPPAAPPAFPVLEQRIETESAQSLEQRWAALWEDVPRPDGGVGSALAGTRIYQLQHNPRLWIIDFPDLEMQSAALNRVAALIERRAAPKDRLVSEAEMARLVAKARQGNAARYFLGHDYRLEALARFFTLARRDGVTLNAAEQALLALLRGLGLLAPTAAGDWRAARPDLAVVTLAGASATPSPRHLSPWERITILRHELSHGEYFTNPRYRQYCQRFWAERNVDEQAAITSGLGLLGYNSSDLELVVNELQAFLWEPEAGVWIDLGLRKLGSSLAALRETFLSGLDRAEDPVSALLAVEVMRRVPAPPRDWGAALRVWSIAKVTEKTK